MIPISLPVVNKDIVRLTASNVFNNAVTFVTGLIIAAIENVDSFGIYSVAVNIAMSTLSFSELGLGIAIVRFYSRCSDDREKSEILQVGISVRLVISSILVILSLPLGWLLSRILSPTRSIVLELTVAVICASILGMWSFIQTLYQARQNYRNYARLTFCYGIIRLLSVAVLAISGMQNVLNYIVALYLVGPLAVTVLAFYALNFKISFHIDKENLVLIKALLSYGKWILLAGIMFPLCYSLPLFLIMRMKGSGPAGLYSIGLMFVAVMGPLSSAIRVYSLPKISGFQNHVDAHDYIVRVGRFAIPYGFCLMALMGVIAAVHEIFLSSKYPDGLVIIEIMVLASGLGIFGGTINSVVHYLGLPHFDAWMNVGRVIFVAIFSAITISYFGVIGAVMSVAAAVVFGELIVFWLISSRIGKVK